MALTNAEKQKYFKYHNLNKRSLENAIRLIKSDIKNHYKKEINESNYVINQVFVNKTRIELLENIRSYNRILFGLMVSWSDESIRRLFYEPNVFSENQINYLLIRKSLEQKWTLSLKLAFCKAYNLIPINNEICQRITINRTRFRNLNPDLIDKYENINNLIKDFLIPAFNIRNKVQHGEWIAAFKAPNSDEYDRILTQKIFKENIVTISSRMTIFNSIYQMIIDLARFNSQNFNLDPNVTPFEYFYNQHISKINYEIEKINNPKLNDYISDLILRKEKGKKYKKKHLTKAIPNKGFVNKIRFFLFKKLCSKLNN